ncbi:hypothetical protein JXB27_02890 [Candidatus Woesearchaeota archaeon]|nr:hypothetical protein [Candidatus Woesearchaeota archaeon]
MNDDLEFIDPDSIQSEDTPSVPAISSDAEAEKSEPRAEYRGQLISKPKVPIYLVAQQEICINPNNHYEEGIMNFFRKKKEQENSNRILITTNNIDFTQTKTLRFDNLLSFEKKHAHPCIEDLGFPSKHVIPVGRGMDVHYNYEPFKFTRHETFENEFRNLFDFLEKNPDEKQAFDETMDRYELPSNKESLDTFVGSADNRVKFVEAYCDYFYGMMQKITPTFESITENPTIFFSTDLFADPVLTRLRADRTTGTWKSSGFFYGLEDSNGNQRLEFADPFSTSGGTAWIPKSLEETAEMLAKELELDKEDKILKRRIIDGFNLNEYISEQGQGCHVNMLKDMGSQITTLPLLDLSKISEKQQAVLYMGSMNKPTRTQSKKLTFSTHPI